MNEAPSWSCVPGYFLCALEELTTIPEWMVLSPMDGEAREVGPPVAGIFLHDGGVETQSYRGPFLGYLLQARKAPAAPQSTHLAFRLLSDGVENTFKLSATEKREIILKIVGTAINAASRRKNRDRAPRRG